MRRRVLLTLALAGAPVFAQQATNAFDDPFLRATSAIANCPVPAGPLYTPEQVREQAHVRAQSGTSCYYSGRCRLPNAYLYDKEIAPRVVQFLNRDERLAESSVWIIVRGRHVVLQGCVRSKEQAETMERSVGLIDDVVGVVPQLSVPGEAPKYQVAPTR
ncbi:MAG TPA: BON domain-containing protein [Ramlibacter sp.]